MESDICPTESLHDRSIHMASLGRARYSLKKTWAPACATHSQKSLAGLLHRVCASACWFVPPRCGFSLVLFLEYHRRALCPNSVVVHASPGRDGDPRGAAHLGRHCDVLQARKVAHVGVVRVTPAAVSFGLAPAQAAGTQPYLASKSPTFVLTVRLEFMNAICACIYHNRSTEF